MPAAPHFQTINMTAPSSIFGSTSTKLACSLDISGHFSESRNEIDTNLAKLMSRTINLGALKVT